MTEAEAGSGAAGKRSAALFACWVLGGVWLVTYLGSSLGWFVPGAAKLALLLLLALAATHASLLYGGRGATLYLVVAIAAGFASEAASIAYGFPFGFYIHTSSGAKLLGVTPQAILVYSVYAWFAWIVARLIVLAQPARLHGRALIVVPIVAALVLAGFDYPFDPIGSALQRRWIYTYPSGQFGVPLTNYLGWVFVGWVIFQILAVAERHFRPAACSSTRSYWLLPCVVWLALAIQYPIYWMNAPSGTVALGNGVFLIADIYEASFAASLFTLVFTGFVAIARLFINEDRTAMKGRVERGGPYHD